MPIAKTCEVCGVLFVVPPVRAQTALTCSRACKGKQTAARYASERIEQVCARCGVAFNYPANEEGRRKYCSYACKDRAQVGTYHGDLLEDGRTWKHTDGYVLETCRYHPYAVNGAVLQHRLVIERELRDRAPDHPFLEALGEALYLRPDIHVHHVNEVKADNASTNLVACTSACHKDLHAGNIPMRGELWPEPETTREREARAVKRHCKHCGKEFLKKLCDVKRGSGLYCSKPCHEASRGADTSLPARIERVCEACGKSFLAARYLVSRGTAKYCSNPCRHALARRHKPTNAHQYLP